MKRTARVGNCLQWRTQDSNQESLALESEEDFSSSDESGEDSEEERLYFEKRIDPKEDFCNRIRKGFINELVKQQISTTLKFAARQ
ncbi:hypothetical protein MHYP_G00311160 [Metynnis hypsauchen]